MIRTILGWLSLQGMSHASSHESLPLPSNRKFGGLFTVLFAGLSAYLASRTAWMGAGLAGAVSLAFAALTLLAPDRLLPLNRAWVKFGLLLGKIVNPLVMALLFFGLFTPLGLLLRLFGRDVLRLKWGGAESCWIERQPDSLPPDSFKFQY
ncbi:MAG: hypothetical protein HQM01_13250 [Magnetococcales bacterium]|nr:hypothetical protein [Magnetococcales bacterium]